MCYLDDILIAGKDTEEHLENLRNVLIRLEAHEAQNSITYLGHVIDADELHPIPEKNEAIDKAPVPKNVSELRSFLAMLNY